MDAALLAEREAFKRKAMAVPTVENKKRKKDEGSASKKQSSSAAASFKTPKSSTSYTSKFGVGGSQYKFGVLGKVKEILFVFLSVAPSFLSLHYTKETKFESMVFTP